MIKVAICVGHNSRKKGAFSKHLNSTEFDYNNRLAKLIKEQVPGAEIFNRKYLGGYTQEISELASRVNRQKFDLVIELHFNAALESANGCEALYYHKSKSGKSLAESYCKAIVTEYGLKNRGAKPLTNSNDRGFAFVTKTKASALILEPFFGSNQEAQLFINVQRHANTIVRWLESLDI